MSEEEKIEDQPTDDIPEPIENENISEPTTVNEQPSSDMEVHHHPQLHHKPKPWKEYLLEGLMIFIAVIMGFFAESFREHLADNTKGKEYVHSMYQDLKADTTELERIIEFKQTDIMYYDSLFYLFQSGAYKTNTSDVYYYMRIMPRQNFFYRVDGTNKQLENAGGYRLVNNRAIVDSLHAYTRKYNELKDLENLEQENSNLLKVSIFKICDGFVYDKMIQGENIKRLSENYPLLNFTSENLNEVHIPANALKRIHMFENILMRQLQTTAKNLMHLMADAYGAESK